MSDQKSVTGELKGYDFYATARNVLLFVLAALATNLGAVHDQLVAWHISAFMITIVLWSILDLGRRYLNDYRNKTNPITGEGNI